MPLYSTDNEHENNVIGPFLCMIKSLEMDLCIIALVSIHFGARREKVRQEIAAHKDEVKDNKRQDEEKGVTVWYSSSGTETSSLTVPTFDPRRT